MTISRTFERVRKHIFDHRFAAVEMALSPFDHVALEMERSSNSVAATVLVDKFFGIPFHVDPNLPEGVVKFIDGKGAEHTIRL